MHIRERDANFVCYFQAENRLLAVVLRYNDYRMGSGPALASEANVV